MASIYANSHVTIAATISDSSDGTCLSLNDRESAQIKLNHPGAFAREPLGHGHMFNSKNTILPIRCSVVLGASRKGSSQLAYYTIPEKKLSSNAELDTDVNVTVSGAEKTKSYQIVLS
ncbi:hypothetical protein BGZ57DRAFT_931742 [Hyaloscypha finlandica]|nr:hypothetical protein BGZ57DRAFT_931742 [Hyaloscypha finlandica]